MSRSAPGTNRISRYTSDGLARAGVSFAVLDGLPKATATKISRSRGLLRLIGFDFSAKFSGGISHGELGDNYFTNRSPIALVSRASPGTQPISKKRSIAKSIDCE